MPLGDEVLAGGDLLLIEGQPQDLEVLRGLQELEVESRVAPHLGKLDSERLTLLDATLDPRSSLAGKTVGGLNFPRAVRHRAGRHLAGRGDSQCRSRERTAAGGRCAAAARSARPAGTVER
ncbi:MAG: hypothetical protein U5K76_09790 [Woeseiaceae bacterium]|nr:hypothetical protein [Woeseiaceae bacterium]